MKRGSRRGILLLYVLSVLMIVLALSAAYQQTAFVTVRTESATRLQAMAYDAMMSGQAYGLTYIQQVVDSRNHRYYRYPTTDCTGAGVGLSEAMEPWCGVERCGSAQGGPGGEATPLQYPVAGRSGEPASPCMPGGRALPSTATWFHYSDVLVPGTTHVKYRLWFQLQLTESLTRNGNLYVDEDDGGVRCGTDVSPPSCHGVPSMVLGPYTPCGDAGPNRCAGCAPYPPSNKILYTLISIGVVEVENQGKPGSYPPIAWARIDTPFQLLEAGYLPDSIPNQAAGHSCFTGPINGMYTRVTPDNGGLKTNRAQAGYPTIHAQPYLYFKQLACEIVQDGPGSMRTNGPSLPGGGGVTPPTIPGDLAP